MIIKDYSYYTSYDIRRNRRGFVGKKSLTALLIFVLIIFFMFVKSFIQTPKEFVLSASVMSPLSDAKTTQTPSPAPILSKESSSLEKIVSSALTNTKGEYAVGILNLKTGEQYFLNGHKQFESASLYKLWVMGAVYKKIEEGLLSSDQILSEDVKILNEKFKIDEEVAEKKEGSIKLSVKDALNLMITQSDNYAALLLAAKIRLSFVQNFLDDFGLTESKVGTASLPPTITAYDTVLFFNKLYNGEFSTSENNKKMLNFLKGQVLNSKLPKYLPDNTEFGHKTGELGQYSHDGGIVFTNAGDYIIAVLSRSSSPKDANERIAEISRGVYKYFVE